MNNTYLFLVYSLCAITIIYLIHAVILTELNKHDKTGDNKTGDNKTGDKHSDKHSDDNYDDNVEMLSYQLRGLYIEFKVEDTFTNIYKHVIGTAFDGKTSLNFTIMCIQFKDHPVEKCKNYDGYKEWSLQEQRNGITFTKNKNINPNIIRNRVIYKLQKVFPDSNITQSHHNCCDYYKITW